MDITKSLKLVLATASNNRIQDLKAKDKSQNLYTVTRWDINTASFLATAPDGSEKYFRYIGNASLKIGDQISITSPDISIIGYGDTQAR